MCYTCCGALVGTRNTTMASLKAINPKLIALQARALPLASPRPKFLINQSQKDKVIIVTQRRSHDYPKEKQAYVDEQILHSMRS